MMEIQCRTLIRVDRAGLILPLGQDDNNVPWLSPYRAAIRLTPEARHRVVIAFGIDPCSFDDEGNFFCKLNFPWERDNLLSWIQSGTMRLDPPHALTVAKEHLLDAGVLIEDELGQVHTRFAHTRILSNPEVCKLYEVVDLVMPNTARERLAAHLVNSRDPKLIAVTSQDVARGSTGKGKRALSISPYTQLLQPV